ncbi:MAG TPA: DsbA family protein [Egibacteraceae bacterium]|nr:DsbA family protein [Egibacteraceae bacterium]
MITLFHDYRSPASAVAVLRLERLAESGMAIEFRGFDPFGLDAALPVTVEVLAEMQAHAGAADDEGLTLRRPPALPPTAAAHAIASIAERQGLGRRWRDSCYRALWERGADLGDAVLTALAGDVGLDRDIAAAAVEDRALLASVRRQFAAHRRQGVGGVPAILAQRTLVPGLLSEQDLRALADLSEPAVAEHPGRVR